MPICEADPWRKQHFEELDCPDDVYIPTEDGDAYRLYPGYRWVDDKQLIAESQGLACGPHGIEPVAFPAFSKPIYNMRGMGAGSRVIRSAREYPTAMRPGHMWSELLSGDHVSTDGGELGGASLARLEEIGLDLGYTMMKRYRIREGDPLSAETEFHQRALFRRDAWEVRIEMRARLAAEADAFRFTANLEAFEGEAGSPSEAGP